MLARHHQTRSRCFRVFGLQDIEAAQDDQFQQLRQQNRDLRKTKDTLQAELVKQKDGTLKYGTMTQ